MVPQFGTSGLRGLVTALTPALVGDHIRAFCRACPVGTGLFIGHDLRPSSPDLAAVVADAAVESGVDVTRCGAVPTPALALAALQAGAGAVMVTGSHIPADRNGLKFYTPQGEITKAEEAAILAALGQPAGQGGGVQRVRQDVGAAYAGRYRRAFGASLTGLHLGLYAQSAVGRDLMGDLLRTLGATVTELGRSAHFVPVDTEAVSDSTRQQLRDWSAAQTFDGIVSTDADGDRPLLTNAAGDVVPGDVLGQITGQVLGAEMAVTPISSNSGAETIFDRVIRTQIGSPHVIAAMAKPPARVVGYEANGGFILGFDAHGPAGSLPRLMTRDALLPLLATLVAARQAGGIAKLCAAQPQRFTARDRLTDIAPAETSDLIAKIDFSAQKNQDFMRQFDLSFLDANRMDGLRLRATTGDIIHLRASGNAPELRIYTEAATAPAAVALLDDVKAWVLAELG